MFALDLGLDVEGVHCGLIIEDGQEPCTLITALTAIRDMAQIESTLYEVPVIQASRLTGTPRNELHDVIYNYAEQYSQLCYQSWTDMVEEEDSLSQSIQDDGQDTEGPTVATGTIVEASLISANHTPDKETGCVLSCSRGVLRVHMRHGYPAIQSVPALLDSQEVWVTASEDLPQFTPTDPTPVTTPAPSLAEAPAEAPERPTTAPAEAPAPVPAQHFQNTQSYATGGGISMVSQSLTDTALHEEVNLSSKELDWVQHIHTVFNKQRLSINVTPSMPTLRSPLGLTKVGQLRMLIRSQLTITLSDEALACTLWQIINTNEQVRRQAKTFFRIINGNDATGTRRQMHQIHNCNGWTLFFKP